MTVANRTEIVSCTCVNAYQDEKYGKGQRLANANSSGMRCTVCGAGATGGKKYSSAPAPTAVATPKKADKKEEKTDNKGKKGKK